MSAFGGVGVGGGGQMRMGSRVLRSEKWCPEVNEWGWGGGGGKSIKHFQPLFICSLLSGTVPLCPSQVSFTAENSSHD